MPNAQVKNVNTAVDPPITWYTDRPKPPRLDQQCALDCDCRVDSGAGGQGLQGDPGPKGDKGDPGDPGADGQNGADGQDGSDGQDGAQGIQGIQGIQGDPGADGQDGADGIQGIQGVQGVQGDPGADGQDGADGTFPQFPVNFLLISTDNVNPATWLGYGTWSAFGAGRVLVGLDSGQTEFDAAGETGGAKTHTLVSGEMPAHGHTQDAHTHTQNSHVHAQQRFPTATGGSTGFTVDTSMSGTPAAANDTAAATAVNQNATATNQNTGGGGAHNNLQPYIVVYFWKRTA